MGQVRADNSRMEKRLGLVGNALGSITPRNAVKQLGSAAL